MSEFVGLAHMTPEAFIELKARAEAAEARVSVLEGILDRAHEIVLTRDARVAELEGSLRQIVAAHEWCMNDAAYKAPEVKDAHYFVSLLNRILAKITSARALLTSPEVTEAPAETKEPRVPTVALYCRICNAELGQPHTRCVYSSIIVSAHETHEPSLASAFAAWPGEETDEELRKAMKEPNDGD